LLTESYELETAPSDSQIYDLSTLISPLCNEPAESSSTLLEGRELVMKNRLPLNLCDRQPGETAKPEPVGGTALLSICMVLHEMNSFISASTVRNGLSGSNEDLI
jgi:hypothetical protein